MIFTPRCSGIEVISTKQNNLIENCQKKKGDNFIEKCQKFCKNNRNNLINDVNVKFIEYTEDQGKGKSKMESIYLRAQEKLEDLDFKNIIEVHNKVVSSGYHNYDGCHIPVKSGINVDFFFKVKTLLSN
jgi:mannitol-specific phosphotransferase system IIBC component